MEFNPKESTRSRAWKSAERFRQNSPLWFWGVGVIGSGGIAGLTAGILWDRSTLDGWQVGIITFGIFVVGFFLIYALIVLRYLLRESKIRERLSRRLSAVKIEIYSATVSGQGGGKWPIEIKLILNIHKPPMQLAELKLFLIRPQGDAPFNSISPNLTLSAERLIDKVNHITTRYEVPFGWWRQSFFPNEEGKYVCRYYIRALVSGKSYRSTEQVFANVDDPLGRGHN